MAHGLEPGAKTERVYCRVPAVATAVAAAGALIVDSAVVAVVSRHCDAH